jgi:hypothetical protein
MKKTTSYRSCLKALAGLVLLQLGNTAMAFTLLPQEQLTPSSTITNSSTTVSAQVLPVARAIQTHLHGSRRTHAPGKFTQNGVMVASNSYTSTRYDFGDMLAYNDLASAGGGGGGDGSANTSSLWISSGYSLLKNNFSRTRYDGDSQMVVAGFDHTSSDTYVLGAALGYQTGTMLTRFNTGDQRSKGYTLTPYFAYLISDALTFDLSVGYGKSNTSQSRALSVLVAGPAVEQWIITSEFASTQTFTSANLTHAATTGNWNLTSALGYLSAKHKQGAYTESIGTNVTGSNTKLSQWSLAEEAAYSHRDSESYLGVAYEKMSSPENFRFASGEQPSNDSDSFLLSLGWRHIGKGLVANFAFNSRLGLANVTENGISTTIRGDF